MKIKKCFVVEYDDFTRQALLEDSPESEVSHITVNEKGREQKFSALLSDTKKIAHIYRMGQDQGKHLSFRIVVVRENETLRFAKESEWKPAKANRHAQQRSVAQQLKNVPRSKLRGRIGKLK